MTSYDVAVLKNSKEVAKYLKSIGGLIGNEVAEKNSDDIKKNFKNIIEKEKTCLINNENDSENEKENKKIDKNQKLNLYKPIKNQEDKRNTIKQSQNNTEKTLTSKAGKNDKKLDNPKKKSDNVKPIYDSEKTLIQANPKGHKHELIKENKKKRLQEAEEKRNEINKKKINTLTGVYDKRLKRLNENEENLKLSIMDKEKNKSLDYGDSDFDADFIDLDDSDNKNDGKLNKFNEEKKEVENNRSENGKNDEKNIINQKTGDENLDKMNDSQSQENKPIDQEKKSNRDVEDINNFKSNGKKANLKLDLKDDETNSNQINKLKQAENKDLNSKNTNLPEINGRNKKKSLLEENKINRKIKTKFKKTNQDPPDNTSSPERNALKRNISLKNQTISRFKFLK